MSVSLQKSPFPVITSLELVQQIICLQKSVKKLPLWSQTPGIYYPPAMNMEQASSQQTAQYKAGLLHGESLMDLTGGFGVDTYFFSRRFQVVYYCERDAALAEIASHNFRELGASNIHVHIGDGIQFLKEFPGESGEAAWIYLDPSRRTAEKGRVYSLEAYQPPLPDVLPELLGISPNLLIKTSPMLDISEGIRKLGPVREVHVVGVKNEVRELLWWLQRDYNKEPDILATDLNYDFPPLKFSTSQESQAEVSHSMPLSYLYEPNASVLKAGGFRTGALEYGLSKLHPHTHLYTSAEAKPFPGRRFKILKTTPYKPGRLPYTKANVSTRNFPESVAKIRKRNRIRDGGSTYLFFAKCLDESLQVLEAKPL